MNKPLWYHLLTFRGKVDVSANAVYRTVTVFIISFDLVSLHVLLLLKHEIPSLVLCPPVTAFMLSSSQKNTEFFRDY